MISRIWPGYLAIWAAVALHIIWALILLWPDTHAMNSTPVHAVWIAMGKGTYLTAGLLAAVASLAMMGTMYFSAHPMWKVALAMPQQLVLGVSAAGAIISMSTSRYADGVHRPGTFIVADQLAIVLAWIAHTEALHFLYLIKRHRLLHPLTAL